MRTVILLARKELASMFDSLMAYLILGVFLLASGTFTWVYGWLTGSDVFLRGLADLSTFFNVAYLLLFLFIPAITMRTLADEKRSGTLDLLLTKAVTDRQVVLGKFFGCLVLIGLTLLCTLPYWITLSFIGNVDHGAMACGYLALMLMSGAYIAIGIYASSLTNNQIVAFLIGLAIMALFHFVLSAIAVNFTGPIGEFLVQLSSFSHYDSISRGVIDSRDLLWFLSLTVVGLGLAELNLSKRLSSAAGKRAWDRGLRRWVLPLVALALLNMIGQRIGFRWDLTEDQRYSLSAPTLQLLERLPEAVTITAYFTEDMPPDMAVARQDMKELLIEYAARSKGKVVFEFVDPNSSDSLEHKAQEVGIQPLLAQTRNRDEATSMRVYMGCEVRLGERKATLPVIQQGSALEWTLSSAIKEVSIQEKAVVGLVQGHGEPGTGALPQLLQSLSVMYDVNPMAIYDTVPIHERFKALLLIDPKDSLNPAQLSRLSDYLKSGRGLIIAYSAVRSDLSASNVVEVRDGSFEAWLRKHGLAVEPRIVVDQRCNQVTMMQQMGNFQLPVQLPFPYFPVISGFGDHPVSNGLDAVVFQFCAPLMPIGDSTMHFSPLLLTSDRSNALPSPQVIDVQRTWSDADFLMGPQVVGAEVESTFGGTQPSRLIVFTNGAFCVNDNGERPQQLHPGNIDLMMNAVDRVTGSNELMGLRGKEINYRPIDDLEDSTRSTIKMVNLLAPVLLAIFYGLARRAWRSAQRKRRMAPDHVR